MRTYALQCVATLLLLATGWLSLRVAARPRLDNEFHRAAWRLTGAMFLIFGLDRVLQNVFQAVALYGGNPSSALTAYLGVAPVFDHSRTFLVLGGAAALLVLAFRKTVPDRRFWKLAWVALAAGLAAGAALGVAEGPFSVVGHFFAVAVWDVVELLVLLGLLFVLMVTNRVDRMLWALLSAYACSVALGIFWFTLLTIMDRSWHPPAWTTHAMRNLFFSVMALTAVLRLRAARRGQAVQGMMGRPVAQRLSMIR